MKIFLDADSCPLRVRSIILKASQRLKIPTYFVANVPISVEGSEYAEFVLVEQGPDIADDYIYDHAEVGDLVITRDIPLAAKLVEKKLAVINDRGVEYTQDNVQSRLSIRDFMYDMREAGFVVEKTSNFSEKDLRLFASTFDKLITKMSKFTK
ncbi:MAG: YaiI/YqxD family protein [Spirochaetales bacterium]|nr:YaiI/YqxD family protein [Spirochaetales bacterium]